MLQGGATYDNINPATEAVIGPVADACRRRHGAGDRRRAPARSTRPPGRPTRRSARRCLLQLKDALDKHKEELRPQIVAEVGAPIGLTYAIQQDSCIDDMQWDIDHDRPLRVRVRARHRTSSSACARTGWCAGADRRRRRDHAVELPVHAEPLEDHARARRGLHGDPQARARHAVLGDVDRQARGRGDRHPARRVQRRHVGGSRRGRRRAHRRSRCRHDLVHGFHRGRQAHRGARFGHVEARVPRARRQVGQRRARRRRLRRGVARARAWCACTPVRAARSPRACSCRARATTRASRSSEGRSRASRTATRPTSPTWPAR